MHLTDEEQAILAGSQGEVMAKALRSVVRYGEIFGATRLAELDGPIHVVTSMGMTGLEAVMDMMDVLIAAGLRTREPFTCNPRPYDLDAVAYTDAEKAELATLYPYQDRYEAQLVALGMKDSRSFSCTAYLPENGNTPDKGDILAWAESSAVVFANSVLGARSNRNSGSIELLCGITGRAPEFGLLTDAGRRATWRIEVATTTLPPATVLGSAIGRRVVADVPYIVGLDRFLGTEIDDPTRDYLKDMGAATASSGAVGLYHVENLTPDAKEQGRDLLAPDARTYVIDDRVLADLVAAFPMPWTDRDATPETALIGCPHLSLSQLRTVSGRITAALEDADRQTVRMRTVLSASPKVIAAFREQEPEAYRRVTGAGVSLSSFCPALHMTSPASASRPVITPSTKLRTYSTARFLADDEVIARIVGAES